MNNEKYTVTRDRVSVHKDVVRKILAHDDHDDSTASDYHNISSSNISVENILEGKRSIKKKRFSQFISPDIMRVKRCNSPSLLSLSTSPFSQKSTPLRRKNLFLNKINHTTPSSIEVDRLFTNWYFMVTLENDQDNPEGLSKENIEETIITNGGQIIGIPSRSLIESHRRNQCHIVLIVLGQTYRTIKFMASLAVGNVPVVRAEWLDQCVNTLSVVAFDKFLVQRGIDDQNKEILQSLDNSDKLCIFENEKVWIFTDSIDTFGDQWKRVLEISGADVTVMDTSNFVSDISNQNCTFAVIERDGVTNNCIKYLRERNIEIVNIEYVTDSLIHNQVLDKDRYRE